MSHKIPIPDKQELINLYIEQLKSPNEIGRIFNCSRPIVKKWLCHYNIPLRDHITSAKNHNASVIGTHKKFKEQQQQLSDYHYCYDKLINENLSTGQLAELLNIPVHLVLKKAQKHGIIKIKKELQLKTKGDNFKKAVELYQEGQTFENISTNNKIKSKATLSKWFQENQIKVRPSNSYPRNFKRISKAEREIGDFIESFDVKILRVDREQLDGKEIDIFVPRYNFGIEYNGTYHHSVNAGKDQYYHLEKIKLANKKGIGLFHVYEDQWKNKKEIIKSMIKHKLKLTDIKIYARDCHIKEVDVNQRISFFNQNHIQGADKAKIAYGLYYHGQLVAVMSFSKPRYNQKFEWELTRFASKLNTSVIGGFYYINTTLQHFYERTH